MRGTYRLSLCKNVSETGVGGAEFPYVLSGMIEEWGGKVIDYPERRHCCGFGFRQYLVQANRGYSLSNTVEKNSIQCSHTNQIWCSRIARDAICSWINGSILQKEMDGTVYGENGESIPVLTYEELAGLVLGYNPWDLGLQIPSWCRSEPLLEKDGN